MRIRKNAERLTRRVEALWSKAEITHGKTRSVLTRRVEALWSKAEITHGKTRSVLTRRVEALWSKAETTAINGGILAAEGACLE